MQPVQKKQQLERKPRSRAWKKKFECKNGKSDHKYIFVNKRKYVVLNWVFNEYRCDVCGKKYIKHVDN